MLHMLMDTNLDVTQQDYVRTAQASGKALVSLINEVLDQAKIEAGKLELEAVRFYLREILDDVFSLFSEKSQDKGVELSVYISDKVPRMLIGDPGRFRQIITNLMGNSIKFTEKGHNFVTVHLVEELMDTTDIVKELSRTNTLSGYPVADNTKSWAGFKIFSQEGSTCSVLSYFSDAINLIVSVEDTSVGIPLEAQSCVFTPFMQVGPSISRTHRGTGIGLSISKCLVGLMNGEIGFVSLPRIGSTFTFTTVFANGCDNSYSQRIQQINQQSRSLEFQDMRAIVVDTRLVRAKASRYHIQQLGIHVEVVSDINNCFSIKSNGEKVTDMVVIEQEVLDKDLRLSTLFVSRIRTFDKGVPPKVFLLANSVNFGRSSSYPFVIVKPLRTSMLAASLQRAMGVGNRGNYRNGEAPSLSLRNLLLGRKILVVDDNNVNLRVAAGALKKYGTDVVCADSGKKAISLLEPPHQFDACFMDIQMPEMDGFKATRRIRDMESAVDDRIQHGEVPLGSSFVHGRPLLYWIVIQIPLVFLSFQRYHPDKNANDPKVADMFNEVTFSYDILSDPTKRHQFDTTGFEAVESHDQEVELDPSSLGPVNTMFAAIFSKLGVPIKTMVSASVLEEALNGMVPIHPLPLGQPVSGRVEKQGAHFYSVVVAEHVANGGLVCRVQSANKSNFKLLYFDKEGNSGLSSAVCADFAHFDKEGNSGLSSAVCADFVCAALY